MFMRNSSALVLLTCVIGLASAAPPRIEYRVTRIARRRAGRVPRLPVAERPHDRYPAGGYTIQDAQEINDKGQIIGRASQAGVPSDFAVRLDPCHGVADGKAASDTPAGPPFNECRYLPLVAG